MAAAEALELEHLNAAENGLDDLTNQSAAHANDPKDHIHTPGDNDKAHSWFRAVFPYDSLQDVENQWHLGNYVIDRDTGTKSFEPMSIYVRMGMHLLYYGSHQENMLRWKRTQTLLKAQSEKIGHLYDSTQSIDHIQPFIESFGLQGSLSELVGNSHLKRYQNQLSLALG